MDSQALKYHYRAFGLNIHSAIEFPELVLSGSPEADIIICLTGNTPEPGPGLNSWRFDSMQFLLRIARLADIEVSEGKRISVSPASGADLRELRMQLLTVCMAALLMQRGHLLLHSSGIVRNGRAVLFAGRSGAGKSSLAAAFRKKGYTFLTDDLCVIQQKSLWHERPGVFASFPMIKLSTETIQMLQDERYQTNPDIWHDGDKYGQYLHEDYVRDSVEIDRIFILDDDRESFQESNIRILTGTEAFLALSKHTYRKQFIHELPLQALHLETITGIAGAVPVLAVAQQCMDAERLCMFLEENM